MNMDSVRPAYPYTDSTLKLSWHSPSAKLVIVISLLLAAYATFSQELLLHRLHLLALHTWLPCLLAILLTIAPDPATDGGRLSKRAVALGTGLSVLTPSWQAVLVLCTPALLALGAAVNLWQERRHVV